MKLRDSLKSDNVRFALTYLIVFTVSVLTLGFATYRAVEQSLVTQLRERIEAEAQQLIGDFHDDGVDELRHDIHERLEANPVNRLQYSVRGPEGRVIFDRISDVNAAPGWHTLEASDESSVLAYVEALEGGYVLTVGANLDQLKNLRAATRRWVGGVLGLTFLLGLLGAWVLVRRFRARLKTFSDAASRVGRGQLRERLRTPSGDRELDQLAETINEMLERIEHLIENAQQVTSNIAHDLRTPLSRLRQRLEQLSDKGAASRDELNEAIALLDECLDTFSALLRIAEIESGAQRKAFSMTDMSGILTRLIDVYEPAATERGIQLSLRLETSRRVQGDERLLSQAVANLIENSMKHASASTIAVSYACADDNVTLAVSDDGTGIPDEERNRVLQPFYRLDRSRTTSGNGLGLSLVRAVAQLHAATLQLDNASPGLTVRIVFEGAGGEA